ncbi:unnamed protein product [Adineta ricciae]|uniref:Uncharacterized protein n=1 Tax=Adineta ricciae TaxID=249248 RepID=A0A815BWJ2_ADIRI|nr:unnamed protein product [Adineta ricciae]CAF1369456.1 unnamed protein product [Adineta ricciae]
MTILKGLCERKNPRLIILMKTWTTALDLLDFLDLLNHWKFYSDLRFVYTILSIWSISCLQFLIQMSSLQKILFQKDFPRLGLIMTDSFLVILTTDIPYLIVRLYAIFGIRNHDYTSYFLVFKNLVSILFQIADISKAFHRKKSKKKISLTNSP